jgi:hypothetical protein
MSVISGLFSIFEFDALKKELRNIKGLRLLLTHPPIKTDETVVGFQSLAGAPFELRFKNQLNQAQKRQRGRIR